MRHHRKTRASVLTAFLGFLCAPAFAQDSTAGDWSVRGGFQLGFRVVDVEGREEKYREDFNLEDGPRLFHLDFDLSPPAELRRHFDHLEMNIENAGGDPFESMRFTIEKYGRYSMKWEQRKSAYFYEDIILPPEVASPELSYGGDLHTFDFDRVRDSAALTLWMGESGRFDLGFERFTKKGESSTTYDVQRDEFEVERPIDESLNEYRAGFSYDWEKVTLVLREHIREYENAVEAFLPGASDGVNPDDPTVLDFFFLNEPYDLSSNGHAARLIVRPNKKLLLQLNATREDFDLDVRPSERSRGTDFRGLPFATDRSGIAEIDRELLLLEASMSYRMSNRLALVLDVENKSLDQKGATNFESVLASTLYGIDTTGSEAGLQFDATSKLSLSAGVRTESREVSTKENPGAAEGQTDHAGYFALAAWRPDRRVSVTAKLDVSSFDDPFSAASPSDRESLRLRARFAQPNGLSLSGSYHLDALDNTTSGWRSDVSHVALRAGYRLSTLSLSMGYSVVDSDRGIDQVVRTLPGFMGGLELFYPIAYRSDTEVIDARVSWAVNPRLKLGGDMRLYDNDGSFALEREQAHAYAEVGFGKNYVGHLGFRRMDYDEGVDDFDDYQADVVEVSLGYRWR